MSGAAWRWVWKLTIGALVFLAGKVDGEAVTCWFAVGWIAGATASFYAEWIQRIRRWPEE